MTGLPRDARRVGALPNDANRPVPSGWGLLDYHQKFMRQPFQIRCIVFSVLSKWLREDRDRGRRCGEPTGPATGCEAR
jgi:hypothetical protein